MHEDGLPIIRFAAGGDVLGLRAEYVQEVSLSWYTRCALSLNAYITTLEECTIGGVHSSTSLAVSAC